MENCTGSSNCTEMARGEFKAFGILIPAMGGMLFALSIPTIIALCITHVIAKALRLYLISTLVSGILINSSSVLTGLIALATEFSGVPLPPLLFCRFNIWIYNIGSVARCFSVAGYSIMVLIVVRYGTNIKLLYITLSLCFVWGVALIPNIHYHVPQAVGYVANAVCLPVQGESI